MGGSATGGMDALLRPETAKGLADAGSGDLSARRLELELGYGLAAFGGRFTGTPEVGLALSDTERELRLGWKLGLARREGNVSFDLELEATRRERVDGDRDPEHGVGLKLSVRW